MIRIDVYSEDIAERTITAKATGKTFVVREQEAWAFLFDQAGRPYPHPMRVTISLRPEQPAYGKGQYTIAPQSIVVNRFGSLDMGAITLRPVQAQAAKVA